MISIGWAEDDDVFSACVSSYFKSEAQSLINLEFVVENGQEMIDRLVNEQTNIVLLDIRMPILDGIETSKMIREKFPNIKIIVFTEFDDEFNIVELYKIGVNSFVAKRNVNELLRAIKVVEKGGIYIPDEIATILQTYLIKTNTGDWRSDIQLTEFESKLIVAICLGKSSFQIGNEFCKSPRTIEEHRDKLYKKLGVKSKAELITKVVRYNLVKIP